MIYDFYVEILHSNTVMRATAPGCLMDQYQKNNQGYPQDPGADDCRGHVVVMSVLRPLELQIYNKYFVLYIYVHVRMYVNKQIYIIYAHRQTKTVNIICCVNWPALVVVTFRIRIATHFITVGPLNIPIRGFGGSGLARGSCHGLRGRSEAGGWKRFSEETVLHVAHALAFWIHAFGTDHRPLAGEPSCYGSDDKTRFYCHDTVRKEINYSK